MDRVSTFAIGLGTFERHAAPSGLPKWDGPTKLRENSVRTPLIYIRNIQKGKPEKEFC